MLFYGAPTPEKPLPRLQSHIRLAGLSYKSLGCWSSMQVMTVESTLFVQRLKISPLWQLVPISVRNPQKGERILDMCAAPGGKTTAIANLMKDEGVIIATDRSHNKVLDIQKLAAEMGLSCRKTFKLDALKSVRQSNDITIFTGPCCSIAHNDVTNQVSSSSNLQVEGMLSTLTDRLKTDVVEENGGLK